MTKQSKTLRLATNGHEYTRMICVYSCPFVAKLYFTGLPRRLRLLAMTEKYFYSANLCPNNKSKTRDFNSSGGIWRPIIQS